METVAGKHVLLTQDNLKQETAHLPWRARFALATLLELPKGSLTVTTPNGKILRVSGKETGPNADITLNNWRLIDRALVGSTIGVAESYMDGDWESGNVTTFLELFVVNEQAGEKLAGNKSFFRELLARVRHWTNRNTKSGSRKNISAHYDLGNRFYKQWLDPSMTYSSALYEEGANDLESAQAAKYRALAEDTGITAKDHVLEIGCGWGGFAEFAAREIGCRVTGLTISKEQFEFATERMIKAGLSDKVEIKLQDYRDEKNRYDRIISIEMFEAVGEKYWPIFFSKVKESLKPCGTAGFQIITIKNEAFHLYRKRPDFIQRYVFPGGMLPSPEILQKLGNKHGLSFLRERAFAQDYARTLAEWRQSFKASWDKIVPLGFDERFKKLWEFYLHYCEAGFRTEHLDIKQLVYRKCNETFTN
ncbi:SAM-dependent methyltransferase [Limoniibacter endophyticus]|uniref:Cyclopropane-fatty-acyl-phospholipid synthase n=1 Tax=Limoniibacter endophyticus TaxID=1565040 RepID=A0A8J3GEW0_9HYPH|nr:cyclopropane-fatty-acyl-phospholipid synthase family protein [Limoniibacter endophyticus]GHC62884.1 cyclopropane-fatty-acyl-phospholipid synthase [Limoniibacter endophyticus]